MSKGLSLYVHLPYCVKKCRYCDFISFTDRYDTAPKYADMLASELSQYDLADYSVDTVYIGGGTPSSVEPEIICSILNTVSKSCRVSPNAEITLECNPCTVDHDKLKAYYDFGINRLSIGVQSFDDKLLKILGRVHDADTAVKCIENAKRAGFGNINADIMFAVPTQTTEQLEQTINKCISLEVEHISLYSLILEEGTKLSEMVNKGDLSPVSDDDDRCMYKNACRQLSDAGYLQYEVSNFAKAGFESRHNTVYWQRGEYIGLGVAAHSYFNGIRYSNTNNLDEYLGGIDVEKNIARGEYVTQISAAEEMIMLGLRMNSGIGLEEFRNVSGFDLEEKYGDAVAQLREEGLISIENGRIRATDAGRDVLNHVIIEIIANF